jgi:large subunit ribosomal protein L5
MEYIPRLKRKYQTEVINSLRGNYKSIMQVPKLVKICLNQGIGKAASDKKQIEAAQQEMTLIAGQKAMLTKSSKDISNFKLRKGMPVGVMVTLRGNQMYEFLDRFITSTMPRIRDFNGVSDTGFDGRGNYTMGIREQIAFPEISIDKISNITGMDITFVTSTTSDAEALEVLKELGFPFKQDDASEKVREEKIEKVREEERRAAEEEAKIEALAEESLVVNKEENDSDVQDSDSEDNNKDLSGTSDKIES